MSQQRDLRKSSHASRENTGAKGVTEGMGRNNSRWIGGSVVFNVIVRQCEINEGRKVSTGCDYKDAGSDFCSESPSVGWGMNKRWKGGQIQLEKGRGCRRNGYKEVSLRKLSVHPPLAKMKKSEHVFGWRKEDSGEKRGRWRYTGERANMKISVLE